VTVRARRAVPDHDGAVPKAVAGFFSFTEITDPTAHRAYNEWHQLDHLPEQLPLTGVVSGERWVCSPRCRAARFAADDELTPVHYVTLYLLAEPLGRTLADFAGLAARLRTEGRFFDARRARLSGPFAVRSRHVAPRVAVSAEAVAHRPTRGVYVVVQPTDAEPVGSAGWVEVPGVAGVWGFDGLDEQPTTTGARWRPGPHRITVAFLDDDPVVVAGRLEPHLPAPPGLRLAGPFEAIVPWRWHWFDQCPQRL